MIERDTIRARLDRVSDPELDESIVELGYVDRIEINDDYGVVTLAFTLPTAWCSPAFAWMMSVDARDEMESITGVNRAVIKIREHMHQHEINEGVNARQSFDASFPEADGEVTSIRATLDDKARLSRQYEAVKSLLEADITPAQICGLTPADINIHAGDDRRSKDTFAAVYLEEKSFAVTVPARPLDRYLRKARTVESFTAESNTLFRTPEGEPVSTSNFDLVHRRGRLAQANMSGQGGVCDALNESRRDKLNRDTPVAADAD